MKIILISFLLLFAKASFGADIFPIEKLNEFLEKKKPCALAVAHLIRATDKKWVDCGKSDCLMGDLVWCVDDGVVNPGGIKEQKGCMLAAYSLTENKTKTIHGRYHIVPGHKCDAGGFESLMKLPYGATPTIQDFLTKPVGGMVYPVLLPSTNQQLSDKYKKLLKEASK